MKGNRDKINGETMPEVEIIKLGKRFQVRFNFSENKATEYRCASFDYEYVNVSKITKKAIKKAIIKTKYDYDDEIAAINNNDVNYQNFREMVNSIAINVIANYE